MKPSYRFKILLLGDPAVGKTSLINKFVQERFEVDYKATIGVDIMSKTVYVDGFEIKLSLWDIAGQDKFRFFRNVFYRGASGAILVFDLTRLSTFTNLDNWVKELNEYIKGKIPLIIIGNKLDLTSMRVVKTLDAKGFAEKLSSSYLETSAKTGLGVNESFTTISKMIFKKPYSTP
ncbi:MAG: Rab family GTPase [Candidatus Odinarchaeota archaeon]